MRFYYDCDCAEAEGKIMVVTKTSRIDKYYFRHIEDAQDFYDDWKDGCVVILFIKDGKTWKSLCNKIVS